MGPSYISAINALFVIDIIRPPYTSRILSSIRSLLFQLAIVLIKGCEDLLDHSAHKVQRLSISWPDLLGREARVVCCIHIGLGCVNEEKRMYPYYDHIARGDAKADS